MDNCTLSQPGSTSDPNVQNGVGELLADHLHLLGPRTPLPALYEEVLRDWQRLPVQTARFQQAKRLLSDICELPNGLKTLAAVIGNPQSPADVRLLSATLWAHARPEDHLPALPESSPINGSDPAWIAAVMARIPYSFTQAEISSMLAFLLADGQDDSRDILPEPLPLLGFLHGLFTGRLPFDTFGTCVLHQRVLHPGVAAHRPLRHLHRLLDYLGLSAQMQVASTYRQLAAQVWPLATAENWAAWQWIVAPGGPELFPPAIRAITDGDISLPRLHELKYLELPDQGVLGSLLQEAGITVSILLAWLRPEVVGLLAEPFPELAAAIRWMTGSNLAATAAVAEVPCWWEWWCHDGLQAARQVLRWLNEVPLPPCPHDDPLEWRYSWLEEHLVPEYRRICSNLLLAQAATGEGIEAILQLAEAHHLPAIRALGMLPVLYEAAFDLLTRLAHTGGRPVQAAAKAALDALARRQGLPDAEELGHRHLLASAWELGPLAGARVRTGWQEGAYRLRLSLQGGRVQLEALGPLGPIATIPEELRRSEAYRQARDAQRETQSQYRLFKQHLERYMLDSTPLTVGEFRYLLANPVFAHIAERLLWRDSHGNVFIWTGPECWETLDGEPVEFLEAHNGTLTLALVHPVELSAAGALSRWQSLAADRRLMQPFKQLFREVYLVSENDTSRCERFAERRIDPRRAYALLRAAGFAPGNGTARREWPHGITAHFCWAQEAAGRDLFGSHRKSEVVTGAIWFTQDGSELALDQVHPTIFSETLRAADLLTTKAAVGDAELTSGETVALRALLLREVARSYRLTNIAVPENGRYAVVLGAHATYRVNLASGTVLLEPEGRQIMAPAHHTRWRPAEDTDTTSEILAIALALAHDDTVDDLTFLAQL